MKHLLSILILLGLMTVKATAGVGDTYSCLTDEAVWIKNDETLSFLPETILMKMEEDHVVFDGEQPYFPEKIEYDRGMVTDTTFLGGSADQNERVLFVNNKLIYTKIYILNTHSVTVHATCEKQF